MLLLLVHGCYSKERKVVRGWRWRCSKRWRERSSCWEPKNPPLFLLLSRLLPSFLKQISPLFSVLLSAQNRPPRFVFLLYSVPFLPSLSLLSSSLLPPFFSPFFFSVLPELHSPQNKLSPSSLIFLSAPL
jgi:hypothetical protein